VPDAIPREILPAGGWQIEANLPTSGIINSLVTRPSNELWIGTPYEVLRYHTDTHEWDEYTTIDGIQAVPRELCLASDGILWGMDIAAGGSDNLPWWSRYNEITDQFEFVGDNAGILHGPASTQSPTCDEDKDGLLWIILQDRSANNQTALYSFDPTTLQSTQHLIASMNSYFSDLAIAPDGMLWIADTSSQQLVVYNPASDEAHPYLGDLWTNDDLSSEGYRGLDNLFFDHQGRLWVQDRGWLDFTTPDQPVWHKIIRSPVFISDFVRLDNQHGWVRPFSTYQSSNGLFWFGSTAGMVRLDPENGEWCLFTTGSSPIAEDEEHNLWIALAGRLYGYPLEP